MQGHLKSIIKFLVRVQLILGVLALGAIVVCDSLGILFRYVLRNPFTWTEELSVILFIWVVFLGATAAAGAKRHIVADIIVGRLSTRCQGYLDILTRLVSICFLGALICGGFKLIPMMHRHYSVALNVPKSVYYMPVTVFAISMCLILVDEVFEIRRTLISFKTSTRGGSVSQA